MRENKTNFRAYYDALPNKERASFRDEFMSRSGMAFPTFYKRLSGKAEFAPLEKELLAKMTGISIDNLFDRQK